MEPQEREIWMLAMARVCEAPSSNPDAHSEDFVQMNKYLFWSSIPGLQSRNLKKLEIGHIINLSSPAFLEDIENEKVKIYSFGNDGNSSYRILMDDFKGILKVYMEAVERRERVVITDLVGLNRAAMVCGALLMKANSWKLLDTFTYVADRIGTVVQIPALQQECYDFAIAHSLLDEPSRLYAVDLTDAQDSRLLNEFQDEILAEFDPDVLDQFQDDQAEDGRSHSTKKKDSSRKGKQHGDMDLLA